MLSRFSVKKPFTIVVAIIIVMILGVVSYTEMSVDLLPNMNMPYAVVVTTYPGAVSEEVEQAVSSPVEQAMASISNVETIQSVSNDNVSMVVMEFAQDTDMDSILLEMSSAVDQLVAQLPDGVGTPLTMKINPNMLPTMLFSVAVDGMSRAEASPYVEQKLLAEFESVEGVASVSTTGLLENMIHVTLSADKIAALQAQLQENIDAAVQEAVDAGNQQMATMQEQAMTLTKEAYALQAEAEQAKTAITTAALRVIADDLRAGLEEEITSLRQQLGDNAAAAEPSLPPVSSETVDALQRLADALAAGDLDNALDLAGALAGQFDPDVLQQALVDALRGYVAAIVPDVNVQQRLEAMLTAAGERAMDDPAVKEATAAYTDLYTQYIAKNEEAAAAKTSLQIAAVMAHTQQSEAAAGTAADGTAADGTDADLDITKEMVTQLLAAQNFDMPAGTITEGDADFIVRTGEKIKSFEDLQRLPLMNVPTIGTIHLEDVADLTRLDNADTMYAKVNGADAIVLSISKQPEYSTADVSEKLYDRMEALRGDNESLSFAVLMDQGEYVNMMIDTILQNLIVGGLLAIVVLFLFLKNIRPTLIVGVSIVICVITAFVTMYFAGISLNIISLCGLALSVGMLVDNSIVVIENIYRLRALGMPVKQAAIDGAKEMSGAVVASTLTTIVVFVPIIFTHGLTRQLFTDMALTIAFALIASLLVALTLVPMAASGLLRRDVNTRAKWFEHVTNGYVRLLDRTLRWRWVTLVVVIALLAGSVFAGFSNGTQLFPDSDSGSISLNVELPADATNEEIARALDSLYAALDTVEDIETVGILNSRSSSGVSLMGGGGTTAYALLRDDRSATTNAVADQIRERTADLGFPVSVSGGGMDLSAMSGGQVVVQVTARELDALRDTAREVADIVSGVEGVTDVDDGLGDPTDELRVVVNKEQAAAHNLTVAQVYAQVAAKFRSPTAATTLTEGDTDYAVYVYDERDKALGTANVADVEITAADGTAVRLGDIAAITTDAGFSQITRIDGERVLQVTASLRDGYNVGKVNEVIQQRLDAHTPADGCRVELAGESESIASTFSDLYLMLALAVVFIYLVMVAQFQSLLSPFIVMFTIPLAFTGGFLALWIAGMPVSVVALIGLVVLVGVVVNNGIVYVDCVNRLRTEEGLGVHAALLEAGRRRIRPIVMTSLTTIIALLISAFDSSAGGALTRPVSVTVIGGMIYSTLLTLFFVPAMYRFFQRDKKTPPQDATEDAPALTSAAQPAPVSDTAGQPQ